jgi:hypothetical protein
MKYILLIIILLLLVILFIIYNETSTESFNTVHESINTNIGNQVCIYFYRLGQSIFKEEDFTYNENSDKFFLKDLPRYITYDNKLKYIRNQLLLKLPVDFLNHINPDGLWEILNSQREYFWLCMKDLLYNILNDTFIKCDLVKNIEYPIIHFRCSDGPHNKHPNYKFQYYNFYGDALNYIIKNTGINYKKVYICYSNSWGSYGSNKESCDIYFNNMKEYIQSIGYEPLHLNGSDIDDFASMFYTPAVISPSSSFSFMSGFFGKGIFVSAGHYFNPDEKCTDCGYWLFQGYDLDHNQVYNYDDTDQVLKLLRNNSQEISDKIELRNWWGDDPESL